MKVKCEVTLDVDPEAVALEYGIQPGEVRHFVKNAVASDAQQQWDALGLLRTPTRRDPAPG